MQQLLTDAGVHGGKVIVSLGVNYVKGAIMGVMVPMLTDALKDALEEAKEESKGEEKVEIKGRQPIEVRLWKDEKERGVDTNVLHLESCPTMYNGFGPDWTGYKLYTVKIGTDKKTNLFYSVGYDVTLRHANMKQLDEGVRKEFKDDAKALEGLRPLPADTVHGTKCFCMVRTVDPGSQVSLMRPYVQDLAKKPFCHSQYASNLFRIGEDYKSQALLKAVFDQAVTDTVEEYLGRPACKWCEFKEPFDEAEAIRQLLYLVCSYEFLPRLRGMVNPPVCARNAKLAAESALIGVLDTAAAGWAKSMDTVNKLKADALKAVEDAGASLVEKLKPHLMKVLEKVNSKMKKGEKKGEPAPSEKMGDVTFVWKLERTPIGGKLHTNMGTGPAKGAIKAAEPELNPKHVIESELKSVADGIGGDGFSEVPGIKDAIQEISSKISEKLWRFNSLQPLLEAAEVLAGVRDDEEKTLTAAAGNAEGIAKAIDSVAAALWDNGLTKAVMDMFSKYVHIRNSVKSAYAGPSYPEKAATAMIEFADYLYQTHVRALNALRVRYCILLRGSLAGDAIATAEAIATASKAAFRQAFFEVADILMDDFWVKMCDIIVLYACESAFAKFKKEVWPEMQEILEPIKSVLPEPIAKAAVHEKIILKIIEVVINKAMTFVTKKLLIFAEKKLFAQA